MSELCKIGSTNLTCDAEDRHSVLHITIFSCSKLTPDIQTGKLGHLFAHFDGTNHKRGSRC